MSGRTLSTAMRVNSRSIATVILALVLALPNDAWAEEGDGAPTWMGYLPSVSTKTSGGRCFWGDELLFRDWRIQRNVLTGHCRLLDGDDRRQTWGDLETCRAALDDI